jgi:hypothetical protein
MLLKYEISVGWVMSRVTLANDKHSFIGHMTVGSYKKQNPPKAWVCMLVGVIVP